MDQTDGVSIDHQKIHEEVPQLVEVLKEMKDGLDMVTSKVQALTEKVKKNKFSTGEGMSYLEAKHLLLISYCQSLVYYLLRKAEGLSIEGHPVVRSLVEIRLFLEKIRPIDKKCRYLIERLLRTSATGAIKLDNGIKGADETQKTDDLLLYKPQPDKLRARDDVKSDGHGTGLYEPPRFAPTIMDEEEGKKTNRQARNDRRKVEEVVHKSLRSDEFRNMMDDAEGKPEEVIDRVATESKDNKFYRQWEKRAQQEEELFTRAPITKDEKRKLKQMKRSNGLIGLADFSDELKMLPTLEEHASKTKTSRVGSTSGMERKHNKRKRKH